MTDFIIIGNINAITYKEIFPLIKDNEVWLGLNHISTFKKYGSEELGKVACRWLTNVDHKTKHIPIDLYKRYSNEYPKYDNYDAIDCGKVVEIPMDYNGVIGVPITFLDKYCPEQFEIVGLDRYVEDNPHYGHRFTINGKETYARILIRKRTA